MSWRTSRSSWNRMRREADTEAARAAGSASGDGHLECQWRGPRRAGER